MQLIVHENADFAGGGRHFGGSERLETVLDAGLGSAARAAVAALLDGAFGAAGAAAATPVVRVLAWGDDGALVGHQGVASVGVADGPAVAGLGGLCVRPDRRRAGLGRRLIEAGVEAALGVAPVMVTRTEVVAPVFAALGFLPAGDGVLAVRDGAWEPVSDVWIRGGPGSLRLATALF